MTRTGNLICCTAHSYTSSVTSTDTAMIAKNGNFFGSLDKNMYCTLFLLLEAPLQTTVKGAEQPHIGILGQALLL
jgi:hypothetical protein